MNIRELFDNKIGRFSIDSNFVSLEDKEILREIFSKVIVVRCECLDYDHRYEYYAFSDCFDKRNVGEVIPEYQVIIKKEIVNESSVYDVKFEKKE